MSDDTLPPGGDVLVHVQTPAGLFEHPFPKTITVADAIRVICEVKGLDQGEPWQLLHDGVALAPAATLVGSGLVGEADLVLQAIGGSV